MKTNPDTKFLEPPDLVADNVYIVILPTVGSPIRRSKGADLMVYEGEMILHGSTYSDMNTAIAELKEIADNTNGANGDLSIIAPAIKGEVDNSQYLATIRYKWEKLTNRG